MVTENGFSGSDWVALDGKVHDGNRIDFLHRYLLSLEKVIEEGIPVIGYQCWSIMDNYEWTGGYDQRFGMIHIDYRTLKRTIKNSGYWYHDVIASNGESL
jgi:beta-glucosidase